jgi:hypothetical protein
MSYTIMRNRPCELRIKPVKTGQVVRVVQINIASRNGGRKQAWIEDGGSRIETAKRDSQSAIRYLLSSILIFIPHSAATGFPLHTARIIPSSYSSTSGAISAIIAVTTSPGVIVAATTANPK